MRGPFSHYVTPQHNLSLSVLTREHKWITIPNEHTVSSLLTSRAVACASLSGWRALLVYADFKGCRDDC